MKSLLIYGMGRESSKFIKNIMHSIYWKIIAITDSTINTRGGIRNRRDFISNDCAGGYRQDGK